MARLRRSDPRSEGITRRRRGKGFSYFHQGKPVTDPATLERIRALVIPPAWRQVWICLDPQGHLQATGVDDAGRRQYRYHDLWRIRRDAAKFSHMLEVATALPRLRKRVEAGLSQRGLSRERVLAAAARLLDSAVIRTGGEGYANDDPVEWNGSTFVVCTATIAPKVAALSADPRVALTIDTNEFPPNVLLVRGTASVEIVDGIPEEFLRTSRRTMSEEQYEEWKPGVEGFYEQMARIEITPNWAKVLDFDTRLPSAVEELAERAARR